MLYIWLLLIVFPMKKEGVLFDFKNESTTKGWTIVDDVVMGGQSSGHFKINKDGNGLFYGEVSLKNNGGFSSVRYGVSTKSVEDFNSIKIRIKGDKKSYQFRVKSKNSDYQSYVYIFDTSGEWEDIVIPFNSLEPRFRGRQLDMPNYPGETMAELAFLISNGNAESFALEIQSACLNK